MQFFTSELWQQMNSQSIEERALATKIWDENRRQYQTMLMHSCGQNTELINKMISLDRFLHDGLIAKVIFFQRKRVNGCKLEIVGINKTFVITMRQVSKVNFCISSFQWSVSSKLHWGYSEFEFTGENVMRLSILCDPKNEMLFEFEEIIVDEK